MRGKKPEWALFLDCDLRVVDGDDLEWRGRRYRLDGYDAPETHNFRSRRDRGLEEKRGLKAMFRLATLIRGARLFHLVPVSTNPLPGRGTRFCAVALLNGWDVAKVAISEGWGVRLFRKPDGTVLGRKEIDWGDPRTPFPDHLPFPDDFSEEDYDRGLAESA